MNLNTLKTFRQQVYGCMERRADALFSLCDGLLSEPQARSLPELAHSPFFERQWPSVYAALADGKINLDELRALCVGQVLADLPADAPPEFIDFESVEGMILCAEMHEAAIKQLNKQLGKTVFISI